MKNFWLRAWSRVIQMELFTVFCSREQLCIMGKQKLEPDLTWFQLLVPLMF